eukprot:scpid71093/ scgid8009/ 
MLTCSPALQVGRTLCYRIDNIQVMLCTKHELFLCADSRHSIWNGASLQDSKQNQQSVQRVPLHSQTVKSAGSNTTITTIISEPSQKQWHFATLSNSSELRTSVHVIEHRTLDGGLWK